MRLRSEPSITSRSVWQSPAARTRTSTSVGFRGVAMTVSTTIGVLGVCKTAARYFSGI